MTIIKKKLEVIMCIENETGIEYMQITPTAAELTNIKSVHVFFDFKVPNSEFYAVLKNDQSEYKGDFKTIIDNLLKLNEQYDKFTLDKENNLIISSKIYSLENQEVKTLFKNLFKTVFERFDLSKVDSEKFNEYCTVHGLDYQLFVKKHKRTSWIFNASEIQQQVGHSKLEFTY